MLPYKRRLIPEEEEQFRSGPRPWRSTTLKLQELWRQPSSKGSSSFVGSWDIKILAMKDVLHTLERPPVKRDSSRCNCQLVATSRCGRAMRPEPKSSQGRTLMTFTAFLVQRFMGLAPESITRVKKACCGLVEVVYRSVRQFFQTIGLDRIWSDPCCWVYAPEGKP